VEWIGKIGSQCGMKWGRGEGKEVEEEEEGKGLG
jgi:hypothetical protein